MRKKIFTFLLALVTSVGMSWATDPIVISTNTGQSSYTQGDITITCSKPGTDSDGFYLQESGNETATITNSGSSTISQIELEIGWFPQNRTYVRANGAESTSSDQYSITFTNVNSNNVTLTITNEKIQIRKVTITLADEGGSTNPSGSCGTNLSWEFNPATGALTITGSGAMPTIWDSPASVSWHEYRADITSVSLPDGLTTIGGYAFYNCPGLTSVTIPENVTNIAIAAFASCANLASVTLPNSVLSIGQSALALCPSMTSLTLGSGLSSIGAAAFSGCSGLESVTNYATTPQVLDSYAFYNVDISNCELYVPEESVAAYQAATTWKDFKNVQAIGPAPTPTGEQVPTNEDPEHAGVYYATFFDSAKKYALPNDGTEAYAAEVSGDALLLHKIAEGNDVLPANTAVIFKASSSTITLTESDADAVTVTATNNLHGVNVATSVDDIPEAGNTIYVLSGEDGVVGFYKYAGATLGAHKAYIALDAKGAAKAPRRLVFHTDEEQGIEDVQNAVQSTKLIENGQLVIIKNGIRYNAQGQELR